MLESDGTRTSEATPGENGGPERATRGEAYCAVCGIRLPADRSGIERFGEGFCSDDHAEEFAQAVRASRVQTAAVRVAGEALPPEPGPARWKASLGKALCWGAPALAIVFVLAGGGAALGVAGAALPVLAMLACPLGMYLMMRSMSTTGHQGGAPHKDGEQR